MPVLDVKRGLAPFDTLEEGAMVQKRAVRIGVDVALCVVLVAVMATALVEEVPHEWLGIALFVLITAHVVGNRRWIVAVARARRNALQTLQLASMALLVGCIVGLMVSSLILSKHVFGFLPVLPGTAWARRAHMLCSYWAFVLSFVHAGLHARLPRHMDARPLWAARIAWGIVACFGLWSFVSLDFPAYLLGQVYFAAVDYGAPLALTCARYASVATLIAGAAHYLRAALSHFLRANKSNSRAMDR